MEGFTFDIATPLQTLVDSSVGLAQDAAPVILGGIAIFATVNIGLRLAKRYMSKIG